MYRCCVCLLLMAAFAVVSTVPRPVVLGQGAKKAQKGGVIEIGKGKDGKYRFFVRDGEGKLLAMSSPGGFASEKDAKEAIDTLKEVVSKAKVTMAAPKEKKDKKKK